MTDITIKGCLFYPKQGFFGAVTSQTTGNIHISDDMFVFKPNSIQTQIRSRTEPIIIQLNLINRVEKNKIKGFIPVKSMILHLKDGSTWVFARGIGGVSMHEVADKILRLKEKHFPL